MIGRSVLSEQEIRSLLVENYGIGPVSDITLLRGGSAECYDVRATQGHFVLKHFRPKYSVADVEVEPEVTRHAAGHGVPTVNFIATLTGEYVWECRSRAAHLRRFVEGRIFGQNAAPDWLLQQSSVLLGRLHAALRGFPAMKKGFPDPWFAWDPAAKKRQYEELIGAAKGLRAGTKRDRILNDLHYKKRLMKPGKHPEIDPAKPTFGNSHGDYHILQLICREESVKAVIDFSSACELPLMWEVIRSYSLGDPACAKGELDVGRLQEYVRRYLEAGGELSRYDLRMMPYLYHLQLARSRYGYLEYLSQGQQGFIHSGSPEGLEDLLQFGFWRTDMCRWLEANAGSVSLALGELPK